MAELKKSNPNNSVEVIQPHFTETWIYLQGALNAREKISGLEKILGLEKNLGL